MLQLRFGVCCFCAAAAAWPGPQEVLVDRGLQLGGGWLEYADRLMQKEEDPETLRRLLGEFPEETSFRAIHSKVLYFKELISGRYGVSHLRGSTFLDVACGQGLASLAAGLLEARKVVSTDADTRPVLMLRKLIDETPGLNLRFPDFDAWHIVQGDILDAGFVTSGALPRAPYVWSYGALHRSGHLRKALTNVAHLVRRPHGLLSLDLQTKERSVDLEQWERFKANWNATTPGFKQEALVAYVMSELVLGPGRELLERLAAEAAQDPGLLTQSNRFDRFDLVLKFIRQRFSETSTGRGLDFMSDAVDWLGGHPYEAWATGDVLRLLHSLPQPLRALHGAWGNSTGLLLAPFAAGEAWTDTWAAVCASRAEDATRPDGLLATGRVTYDITQSGMKPFTYLLERCRSLESLSGDLARLCAAMESAAKSLSQENVCFVVPQMFSAQDQAYTMILEDGQLLGWGDADCAPDGGAGFRFFPESGLMVFQTAGQSDPRENGREYKLLMRKP